ncbi:Carboxylesterase, type B [Teratosphaeria destructans]|uniref:Carboxylic ester hydrolase n=1 Tax=Teratosphaeria destructans TaxID=418781 RepID=A0A9W7SRZ0_9PEZI|nr:Carboxylesterase, type B [Teratosphaeria destructans]
MKPTTVLAALTVAALAEGHNPPCHQSASNNDLAAPSGTVSTAPTAYDEIDRVTYIGLFQNEVENFFGIHYAQDTGGPNRFRPPQVFTPTKGSVINATDRGPACPQELGTTGWPLYLGNITSYSEDCLRLNVYRPKGAKAGDKLPVLVHIHGGSFILASKDETTIQPGGLILESIANGHPVMQVNTNYRLGVFGFAKSDDLTAEGSANAGLKDQRLALEWVKDHIESFGGDAGRITVFGQSSGGLAVGMQILAYGNTKPVPFQQSISESQTLEGGITGNFTDIAMRKLVNATACNTTSIQSAQTIACLRNLTTDQLLDAQTATGSSDPDANNGDEWLPIVDGDFLPDAPSTLIQQGRFANITAVMGWTEDDCNPFVPTTITTANDTRDFIMQFNPGLAAANVQKMLELYPVSEFPATVHPSANLSAEFYRSARMYRDILMVCQPYYFGHAITEKKGRNVYMYDQNQTILGPILDYFDTPGLGVVHTSEFAYVFGNLSHYNISGWPYEPKPADFALKRRESRTWSTFASFGIPSLEGHETLKAWTPAFGTANETDFFVIGGPGEGLFADDGPGSNPAVEAQRLKERCGFINSIVKQWEY